jgi:hypothetical protein
MGLTILKNLENYEFVNGIDDIPFFEMENKKCLKQSTSFNLSNCPDQYLTYAFNLPKACHDKHCKKHRNIGPLPAIQIGPEHL